jgi:hypothetical protein
MMISNENVERFVLDCQRHDEQQTRMRIPTLPKEAAATEIVHRFEKTLRLHLQTFEHGLRGIAQWHLFPRLISLHNR